MSSISAKSIAKGIRDVEWFNHTATTCMRALLNATGIRGEGLIRRFRRVGIARYKLPNGRVMCLRCYPDDGISNPLWWRGWSSYEPETAALFFQLASRAQLTIDIGAYIGYYALLAAHANPGGRVFAFEPVPSVFDRLHGNVDLNGLETLECICSAVGETEGMVEFFSSKEFPTISGFSSEFVHSWGEARRTRVPVLTIDRFVEQKNIGRVDLVKLDTETSEPEVLRGMIRVLERDRPAIVCEVHPGGGTEDSLQGLIGPLGYNYYLLTSSGPIKQDRIQGHSIWSNYLFMNRESEGLLRDIR